MTHEFEGEEFYDDRMFTFYLCAVTTAISGDMREITLYHEEAPHDHEWGVVLYRNSGRMMPAKVLFFKTKDEAVKHYTQIAPQVPRISLDGKSPLHPPSFVEYAEWMQSNGLDEYDYAKFFPDGGDNPKERIYQKL